LHGGKNYLQVLREFCDKYGILLIFDEVQSGMGRTGKWFASEHFGVVPDIQVMAKGLSGGMPLGAFVARKDLMKQMPPGSHGTTFGGNPVSCAAALKMIEILKRDKVIENVVKKGEEVFEFISSKFPNSDTRNPVPEGSPKTNSPKSGHGFSAYHNPKIQVRGLGLMIALVFPDAEIVNKIKKQALAEGLLLLGCGTYGNIIRLAPDLLISSADLRAGLEIITKIIEE
jgi:4-aminobutyrate aminotransferase